MGYKCLMGKNLVIYYVDDDPEDLDVLAEIGMGMGIEVIPIHGTNGVQDKISADKEGTKVIFLDVNMPVKSGFDLLEELKHSETCQNLPIVTFSTGHDLETIEKCWQLGADMYIRKGQSVVRYKEILAQVNSIDWQHYTRNEENFILTA